MGLVSYAEVITIREQVNVMMAIQLGMLLVSGLISILAN